MTHIVGPLLLVNMTIARTIEKLIKHISFQKAPRRSKANGKQLMRYYKYVKTSKVNIQVN